MTDQPVLKISKELLLLAAERGAAEAMRQYVEGAFKAQFAPLTLTLVPANVNVPDFIDLDINVPGYTIELIE